MSHSLQSDDDKYIDAIKQAFPDGTIKIPLFHRGKVHNVSIEPDGSTKTTMEDMSPSSLLRWKGLMDSAGIDPKEYM